MLKIKLVTRIYILFAFLFSLIPVCAESCIEEDNKLNITEDNLNNEMCVEDYIILNTPEYKKHNETLVVFSHNKHLAVHDSQGYGISCGECHHDEEGSPLDLKIGDEVERCVECHSNTGKKPKEEHLSKREEIIKYHKKALHANCRNCHGKFNKKNNLKRGDIGSAPTKCSGCHPKS